VAIDDRRIGLLIISLHHLRVVENSAMSHPALILIRDHVLKSLGLWKAIPQGCFASNINHSRTTGHLLSRSLSQGLSVAGEDLRRHESVPKRAIEDATIV
jgi:hypothetical protein